MKNFPFDKYKFLLFQIERPDNNLCKLLAENGYISLNEIHEGRHVDVFFIHTDFLDLH